MPVTRRTFIESVSAAALLAANRALAQSDELTDLTLADASVLIRSGNLSPVELTRAYLARIERVDGDVNSYITVTAELALEQARLLETELSSGRWRGPLHGMPIALKDNIDTAGIRTTAASAVLADRVPAEDAAIYRRLREAGAVLLGKLNMHEFAYGGTSAITHFGPVHNPWNLDHIPGGSSGGSAAAVAARLCSAALGTDTLASIRQPASYCGVSGFKPTHGLSSIRGIIPVAESLDHVGPLCRTANDCALMFGAMAGYDPLDPVSIRAELPDFGSAPLRSTRTLRLGLPAGDYFARLHRDVERAVDRAVAVLTDLSSGAREVTLPAVPNFGILLAEGYAYHEQYLSDPEKRALYNPVTLERLVAAGQIPAADYIRAMRELSLARHAIASVFDEVDLLVTPTVPSLPERIDAARNPAEPSGAESSVRNTAPFNIYGIPTVSIPCGFSGSGLPIGIQISGPHLGELKVLALAHAYQQLTDWRARRPSL